MTVKMCKTCGKRPARPYSEDCGYCWYRKLYGYTISQPFENRDWEWAHCEECGSSLGNDGECHNTSCGNSPDVGKDWF